MVILDGNSGNNQSSPSSQPPTANLPPIEGNLMKDGPTAMGDNQPNNQNNQKMMMMEKDNSKTNLIINYLPQSMTEKELYSMFVTIGPVESCRVMKDYKTGYSYGFGFVNYTKAEDATTAINTLNGLSVQNKRLKVSFARPSGEEIKETNLYVTNLPRNITEKQVEEIFNKFGQIVQKNVLKDKLTGLPRGVAFVRYDKREEAQDAINKLHGTIPEGGSEPLSVKIAEEHGKQKAAYYAGWQAGFNQSRGGGVVAGRGRGFGAQGWDRQSTVPFDFSGGGIGGGRGRGYGAGPMPGGGMGMGGGPGLGGGLPMMGRGAGGFGGPRGGHHGGFTGGPGAVRMDKLHPHRFNPMGLSGAGGGANAGGGYSQPHFW